MKRVAIIGAGGGGLCAAKHLLSHIGVVEPPVIYEQSNHVGGTWVYEAITPNCDEPFSSMYENLRTNLPKEVMSFPDMSHPRNLPSFLHHTEIKKYIENYAKKFKLYDHIRFQTKVDHVTPNTGGGGWKVTTIENGDKENMETYDSILTLFQTILPTNTRAKESLPKQDHS
uniref:Flavin-containing monooxygenase n=1 Tax=Clytia hemisphaerica TaxID=252671 RepID=A0A7M5TUQ0_9CNID